MSSPWTAKWIWKKQKDYQQYNTTVVARKSFKLAAIESGQIRVTADSYYRLTVNGRWVMDGPARGWPEHYSFDEADITSFLQAGENTIEVIARYHGIGNFHAVPRQAGLLCECQIKQGNGRTLVVASDRTWSVATANAWIRMTPKVSIQMPPMEVYDSRMESLKWEPAVELYAVSDAPWKDLRARGTAVLSKEPVHFSRFMGARLMEASPDDSSWVPMALLCHPGLSEANVGTCHAGLLAAEVVAKKNTGIKIAGGLLTYLLDGVRIELGRAIMVKKGRHLLVAYVHDPFNHWREVLFRIEKNPDLSFHNPLKAGYENPWCFARLPESNYVATDMIWQAFPAFTEPLNGIRESIKQRVSPIHDVPSLIAAMGKSLKVMPSAEMFVTDPHDDFLIRVVKEENAQRYVNDAANLIHDNPSVTVVRPPSGEILELCYDLGRQVCGYYEMELVAEAGVWVDVMGVEYIAANGTIQHTQGNRNGVRYVTKAGNNRFLSTVRRSGRYLFVTIRNAKRPVQIRLLRVIESTYPVHRVGAFTCSDARLDKVWEIAERTLKLCMEDSFTDCPLYEQTLWVGDARNESQFGYTMFGSTDIARRCIEVTAQSLERYPIVGAQVPSCWDMLLPAWSFLWGISVWDYYFYSADKTFLKRIWPAVCLNLKNAEAMCTDKGLFSGPYWNMFDWTGVDDRRETVIHNSLFVVGAIDAALKCAAILGDAKKTKWLREFRARLKKAINRQWDAKRKTYPDSFTSEGKVGKTVSMHTSFLSLLYDVIESRNRQSAIQNTIAPPKDMVRVGSPFAMMYLYESLEKLDMPERILQSIYDSYLPMVEDGATTVWEVFSTSNDRPSGFPTRSHCHAWSSAPLYFLPRILLGVRQTVPGGEAYEISPRPLGGMDRAASTIATAKGPLEVSWTLAGKTIAVKVVAPTGVKWTFKTNPMLKKLKVTVNS